MEEGYVEVKRSALVVKEEGAMVTNVSKPPLRLESSDVQELQKLLDYCAMVVGKLGSSVSPWGLSKNQKRAQEASMNLENNRMSLMNKLGAALRESESARAEVLEARDHLAERLTLIDKNAQLRTKLHEQEERLTQQAEQIKSLLSKVDGGELARKEARDAKGGRFPGEEKEARVQQLTSKVDSLLSEHRELQAANALLLKTKADQGRKLKEAGDKLRDETEVRDREIRRLQAELRKALEAKESSMSSAKEQVSSQLASRSKEVKTLQFRCDTLRAEMETLKAGSKTLKAAADEAEAAMSKAQEEARAAAKKLADMRVARDDVVRELEQAKREQDMLHSEFQAAQTRSSISSAALSKYYNTSSPWPRIAFRTKDGRCLHNTPCGGFETVKCTSLEYHSHRELEGLLGREGLVLCHNCRTEQGF